MDITKAIIKSLNGYIFNLSEKISQEHNIPIEEILNIWCDQQNISFTNVFIPMLKLSKKQHKKSIDIENNIDSFIEEQHYVDTPKSSSCEDEKIIKTVNLNETSKLCEYIFTRGPKKDKQCTIMAKSGNLCSKHKLSNKV